jgi:MoxR-like ATPase
MLDRFNLFDPLDELTSVVTLDEILNLQKEYHQVFVSKEVRDYILTIVRGTRNHKEIILGCSPRASLSLMKATQAYAAIMGRDYVIPEDVKFMAVAVLSHRITVRNLLGSQHEKAEEIINGILNTVEAPLEKL